MSELESSLYLTHPGLVYFKSLRTQSVKLVSVMPNYLCIYTPAIVVTDY